MEVPTQGGVIQLADMEPVPSRFSCGLSSLR